MSTSCRITHPQVGPPERTHLHLAMIILTALLGAVTLLSLSVGAVKLTPSDVLAVLAQRFGIGDPGAVNMQHDGVLLAIRLPRTLLGLTVGAGLALSGAALQGLLRNPLADPGLIGVSGGAAFAAATLIVFGDQFISDLPKPAAVLLSPLAAFAGGLVTTLAVYRVATVGRRTAVTTLLLAGLAIGALTGAATGIVIFVASDAQLRTFTFWSLGSLGGATWPTISAAAPLMAMAAWRLSKLVTARALRNE